MSIILSSTLRRALLLLVGLLLLLFAWSGLTQGFSQFPESRTRGQTLQTLTQFCFGLFALLSLLSTFWFRRWNTFMLAAWTVSVTLAAGLASVVWGGTSFLIGVVSGAGALLVGLGIAWLLRVAARGATSSWS